MALLEDLHRDPALEPYLHAGCAIPRWVDLFTNIPLAFLANVDADDEEDEDELEDDEVQWVSLNTIHIRN